MQIIVAIALICGEIVCSNVVYEPRFEDLATCEVYINNERQVRSLNQEQVVLDDCILTTEEIMKEFE
ncbi:hypothetical protein UFOVP1202_39 [uncultured Caudovirales phage]|uniref:Uncharacterized protein n=1 Tax=uncultured Caudovirales phage TaxID=2100421 RepID=A0A6J5QZV1_9CAUD|nr:hypothetical protein UFOVP1202_39 [uncultured Caudovirales phage]